MNDLLSRGFPISFELGIITIAVAVVSGILVGIIAALRHNGFLDYLTMGIAVLGISIPNFILATLLIQQLAVNLEIFPTATWRSPAHMVLPVLALATGFNGNHCPADSLHHAGGADTGLYQNG